jgi:hypothetical protein
MEAAAPRPVEKASKYEALCPMLNAPIRTLKKTCERILNYRF